MTSPLKPAILIVSDTASQNPASDKTVDALKPVLWAEGKWECPVVKIVPDNILDIQRTICDWTDGADWRNLILLSGGTGFAVKDNTPEAVSPLIHRHAPGLVHGMIDASLKITPCKLSPPLSMARGSPLTYA